MRKLRNQTAMISNIKKGGRAIMAVISQAKMNEYMNSNLFDLIHNHMPKPKTEHLVVTRYNSPEEKKKRIEKENTHQNLGNSNDHSKENNIISEVKSIKGKKVTVPKESNDKSISKSKTEKIEKVNMDGKVGKINLDTNLGSKRSLKKAKPHPTLAVITGKPTPAQQRDINKKNKPNISIPNKTSKIQYKDKVEEKNNTQPKLKEEKIEQMPDIKDRIMHQKPVEKQSAENKAEDIYSRIQEAASAATFIEKTQVHVKLRAAIDNLPLREINVVDLTDGSESYILLDSMFFHLLGFATIGKNLDIVLMFRDGTQMQIASPKMLSVDNNEEVKQYLIKNNYTFAYKDIKKLADCFKQLSSYVFCNEQITQYYIEFLPVISK